MRARATLIRALLVVGSFFTEGTMAVGGALVARQGTSTSAAPSPSITLTPDFTFTDPQIQPFTCQSATIFWFYNGPESPLSLVVTNVGVSQDSPTPPVPSSTTTRRITLSNDARAVPTGAAEPSSITTIIASNLDPGDMSYTWTSVNVPQGWYILTASLPERAYSVNSQSFFVHPGSSTACLPVATSSSSTSSTPSGSPSPTTTTIPVGASSSSVSIGTIVGISIGAVALVAAILAAWLCLYRKGRKSQGSGGGGSKTRRWNGLDSTDSRMSSSGGGGGASKRTARHDSLGTILITPSDEVGVGAEKNTTAQSVEGSPFNDPVALSPMAASRQSSRGPERTYSTSSSMNDYNFVPPVQARRPSVPDSVIGRRSIDSTNAYPPSSPSSPSNLRNSSTPALISRNNSLRTQQPSPAPWTNTNVVQSPICPSSPASPSDATKQTKQANRQSFGARKRKPVPAYDASLADEAAAAPPPVPPSPSLENSVGNGVGAASSSAGHYATRSLAGHDGSHHELVHKSSFGPGGIEGKPMHYLIPDMPMSAKD